MCVVGSKNQRRRASVSAIRGAPINGIKWAGEGRACSFRKSFRASARGWGRPINPTLLGPLRV